MYLQCLTIQHFFTQSLLVLVLLASQDVFRDLLSQEVFRVGEPVNQVEVVKAGGHREPEVGEPLRTTSAFPPQGL